jgi:hypothetical protein
MRKLEQKSPQMLIQPGVGVEGQGIFTLRGDLWIPQTANPVFVTLLVAALTPGNYRMLM